MGGTIALTIRFETGREWRDSCWTNTLPEGLFAAPFFIDPDSSKRHVDEWLKKLVARRKTNPELEEIWGGWNMLAPVEYGLVIVDYVTSTIVSCQGYCGVDYVYSVEHDPDKQAKYDALEKAGLLIIPGKRNFPAHWKAADIKLPFANSILGDVSECNEVLLEWCERHFAMTDDERAVWSEWLEELAE